MKILPIKALEKTFNRYLSLDTNSPLLLKPLIGRVMGLHIQRPKISLYFAFNETGTEISSDMPEKVDTEIYASLFQLMRLKISTGSAPVNTQFYIKGDVDTAQLFKTLLEQHHIDWEEYLSTMIGDVTAHNMVKLLKKPAAFFKKNTTKFSQDVTEYCQEETQILPSPYEVAGFRQEVDSLRLQIDRLEARITLLTCHDDKHDALAATKNTKPYNNE